MRLLRQAGHEDGLLGESILIRLEIPENAERILAMLNEHGFDAYVVGGCVRDTVLGRVPGDWDITTNARPEQVKAIFRRTIDTGIEHGTVTVRMKGEGYEVTTYRVDGDYSDRRHPDSVTFTDDLREDLRRRDFTINAMAYSPRAGLVDAFGGMADLERRTVRCVGNADERFGEDALRVLRAVRFAAQLDFIIEEETLRAAGRAAQGLAYVSRERIFTELNKTLCSGHPERVSLLFEIGADRQVGPGFTQAGQKAAEGLADAAVLAPERHLRWSALLKDLEPDAVRRLLEDLKSDNETRDRVLLLTARMKEPLPEDAPGIRRLLHEAGPDRFEDLVALKRAGFGLLPGDDCDAAAGLGRQVLEAGDCYELKTLALRGAALIAMGMRPGPELGRTLERLLERVMDEPELNTRERLTELLEERSLQ